VREGSIDLIGGALARHARSQSARSKARGAGSPGRLTRWLARSPSPCIVYIYRFKVHK
jgi:hypothetical protein